jgi:hypothetical protein
MKKFIITEEEKKSIRKMYLFEDDTIKDEDYRIYEFRIYKDGETFVGIKHKDAVDRGQEFKDRKFGFMSMTNQAKINESCRVKDQSGNYIDITFTENSLNQIPEGCKVRMERKNKTYLECDKLGCKTTDSLEFPQ